MRSLNNSLDVDVSHYPFFIPIVSLLVNTRRTVDVETVDPRIADQHSSFVVHVFAQSEFSAGTDRVLRLSGTKFSLLNLLGDFLGIAGSVYQ